MPPKKSRLPKPLDLNQQHHGLKLRLLAQQPVVPPLQIVRRANKLGLRQHPPPLHGARPQPKVKQRCRRLESALGKRFVVPPLPLLPRLKLLLRLLQTPPIRRPKLLPFERQQPFDQLALVGRLLAPFAVVDYPRTPVNVVLHNPTVGFAHNQNGLVRSKRLLQLLRHIALLPLVPHRAPLPFRKLLYRPLLQVPPTTKSDATSSVGLLSPTLPNFLKSIS